MVVSETWRLFKSEFSELLLAVLAAGMLFTMGNVFVLATIDLDAFSTDLKREAVLEVYFEDDVQREQIDSIKTMIASSEGVVAITEKGPDDALDEMSSILGSDLTEVLGFNPLPFSLEVAFVPETHRTSALDSLSTELVKQEAVMEVHFASEWIDNLNRLNRLALVVCVVICAMILLGAAFVFASLQRHIYTKRLQVIHNLVLLGMRKAVVRTSVLLLSGITGALSSIVALAVTFVLWKLAIRYIARFPYFELSTLGLVIVVPIVVAIASSLVTYRSFHPKIKV